jgi:esterase/lipase superfamily enzyme
MRSRDARRLVAVLAALAWSAGVIAAEIEGVRLERDPTSGSSMRLTVGVLFQPDKGDNTLSLQVRAFSAPALEGGKLEPLKARGRDNRDDSGLYRLVGEARRGDAPRSEVVFRVDARELALPPGESRVGLLVLGADRQEGSPIAAAPAARIEVQPHLDGADPAVSVAGIEEPPPPSPASVTVSATTATPFTGLPPIPSKKPLAGATTTATMAAPRVEAPVAPALTAARDSSITRFELELKTRPHLRLDKAQPLAVKRMLHFATNRNKVTEGATLDGSFGNTRDPDDKLTFGSVEVNIPIWFDGRHQHLGDMPRPGFLSYLNPWRQDDDPRVFHAGKPDILTWEKVRDRLRPQPDGHDQDILVLVHGFANTMDDAASRLAQVAYDAEFLGRAMLFSWPSAGSRTFTWEDKESVRFAYYRDKDIAEKCGVPLADLLARLISLQESRTAADVPAPRVHVLAHSMGCRVLQLGLHNLFERPEMRARTEPRKTRKPLGHVVLAAPDIDYASFKSWSNSFNLADDVTIYYTDGDIALTASLWANWVDRLIGIEGYKSRDLSLGTIENVDSKCASTMGLNHDYFAAHPRLLKDLSSLLRENRSAAKRVETLYRLKDVNDNVYWTFCEPSRATSMRLRMDSGVKVLITR